jgi:hypothetical protein
MAIAEHGIHYVRGRLTICSGTTTSSRAAFGALEVTWPAHRRAQGQDQPRELAAAAHSATGMRRPGRQLVEAVLAHGDVVAGHLPTASGMTKAGQARP